MASNSTTPERYICPLTKEVMRNPLVSRWGTTFEAEAILRYLNEGNTECPVTGNPLRPSYLVTNSKLEREIHAWKGMTSTPEEKEDDREGASAIDYLMGTGAIVPKHFICPLSGKAMVKTPMVTRDGVSFEKKYILRWLKNHSTCPVTGNSLAHHGLITNHKLLKEIDEWQKRTGVDLSQIRLMKPHKAKKMLEANSDNNKQTSNGTRFFGLQRFAGSKKPKNIVAKTA